MKVSKPEYSELNNLLKEYLKLKCEEKFLTEKLTDVQNKKLRVEQSVSKLHCFDRACFVVDNAIACITELGNGLAEIEFLDLISGEES